MDQGPVPPEDPIGVKQRNAQYMYARGFISLEEYEALGRLHGWISPLPTRSPTLGTRTQQVASVAGLALLALTAAAEIAARINPALRGPLDSFLDLARALAGGL